MLFGRNFKLFDDGIVGHINFVIGFDIAVNVLKILRHRTIINCASQSVFVVNDNLTTLS